MLEKLLSSLAGSALFAPELPGEHLIALFKQLGSADPRGDLSRVRRGQQSLIGICMHLLCKGEVLSDEVFVQRAYQCLLGREPDQEGFRNYLEGLTNGPMCRAEVIDSFLRSQEFRRLLGMTGCVSSGAPPRPSRLCAYAADWCHRMLYRDRLLPPLSMRHRVGEKLWDVSGQRFEMTGRHFVEKLSRDAGLRPETRILDVGAGCGRIALPLTEVIGPSGCYRGLEAVRAMVRWCRRKITPRFPHFQFLHCNVRNNVYNPRGREKPEAFRFPFDENSFHLVVATSVFTHLLPDAALNYIGQCSRVLRDGGILFGTFFLVESGTRSGDGELVFAHPVQGTALSIDPTFPEKAVAYPTEWLLGAFRRSGLEVLPPVRWGGWSGRARAYSGQDVLILRKQ